MSARWIRVVLPMLAVLSFPLAAHADEPRSGQRLVAVGAGLVAVGYAGSVLLSTDKLFPSEGHFAEPRMAIPLVGPAFGVKHYSKYTDDRTGFRMPGLFGMSSSRVTLINGMELLGTAGVAQVAGLMTLAIGAGEMAKRPRVVVTPDDRGISVAGEF